MGILKRLYYLVTSTMNDLLDKAENPEKLLKQIIREIESIIDRTEEDTTNILSESRRLKNEIEVKEEVIKTWQHRAELAVDEQEDDLAFQALERKRLHEKEQVQLRNQHEETLEAVKQMKENVKMLQNKLVEARARYTSLVARSHAARVSKAAQQKVKKVKQPTGVLDKFEKLERKIQDVEAEANALVAGDRAGGELDKKFALREETRAVDSELAVLKARRA
jgi:phage shock protein A